MGAISPGLGLGTTVYFELPLFSCVSAGKPPLTSSMPDFPPCSPDPPIKDDEELLSTSVSGHSIRMKPRPNRSLGSSSAVLAAGDLHINDTAAAVGSTIQTQSIAHQQLGSSGLELDVIELTLLFSCTEISDFDESNVLLPVSHSLKEACEEKENVQIYSSKQWQRITFMIVVLDNYHCIVLKEIII